MVIFKGDNRIFDSTVVESSSSSSTRTATIYGLTSLSEIMGKNIEIISNAAGTPGSATLNLNNLGAIPIKIINNGNKEDPSINWVASGQTYTVKYNGTEFVVQDKYFDSEKNTYDEANKTIIGTYVTSLDTFTLYRKVFNATISDADPSTESSISIDISTLDVDKIVHIYGIHKDTLDDETDLCINNVDGYRYFKVDRTGNNIDIIYKGVTAKFNGDLRVVLEYTEVPVL